MTQLCLREKCIIAEKWAVAFVFAVLMGWRMECGWKVGLKVGLNADLQWFCTGTKPKGISRDLPSRNKS